MSTVIVHYRRGDHIVNEKYDHQPAYAEAKQMKSLQPVGIGWHQCHHQTGIVYKAT